MSESLHLAVRTVHVLGMAVLLGGAGLVWLAARQRIASITALARTYEWLFWGAFGVLVATGIGNLGALGAPGPATRWGQVVLVKLSLVALFVVASAVRTLAVARIGDTAPVAVATWHERAYGATALSLLGLVALAEVLAHG